MSDFHYEVSPYIFSWTYQSPYGYQYYYSNPVAAQEPSRRIIIFDPETQKFHSGSYHLFPWIMRSNSLCLSRYGYARYYEYYSSSVPPVFLKFYGGFIISDITVDVQNGILVLNGNASWLETPWEGSPSEAISTDFGGFSSSMSTPSINFVNDNLPDIELITFDDEGQEVSEALVVHPEDYTRKNIFFLDAGQKTLTRSLYIKHKLISEQDTNLYYESTITPKEYACEISVTNVRKNVTAFGRALRPWYVKDIPSVLAPIAKDGKLYYRLQDFEISLESEGLFIPRIDWKDESGNIFLVQSPTTPDQINSKPNITSIALKDSSIDLPCHNNTSFIIDREIPLQEAGDYAIIFGDVSAPFGGYGTETEATIISNDVLTESGPLKSLSWDFKQGFILGNTSTSANRKMYCNQVVEAWIDVDGVLHNFDDFDVTPYLYTSTEGQVANASNIVVGYNKITFKPPGVTGIQEADRRIYDFDRLEILNPETDELIRTIPGTQLVKEDPYPYVGFTLLQSDFDACGGENPKLMLYAVRVKDYNVCFRIGDFYSIYWKTGDLHKAIEYGIGEFIASDYLYSDWRGGGIGDGKELSMWSWDLKMSNETVLIPVPQYSITGTMVTFPDVPSDPIIPRIRENRPMWVINGIEKWLFLAVEYNREESDYIYMGSVEPITYDRFEYKDCFVGDVPDGDFWIAFTWPDPTPHVRPQINFRSSNLTMYSAAGIPYGVIDSSTPELLVVSYSTPTFKTDKLLLWHNLQSSLINPNKIV